MDYLFELHYPSNSNFHKESFECDADAMEHGRKVLNEGKRDVNAFLVSVYRRTNYDWKQIVSYQ